MKYTANKITRTSLVATVVVSALTFGTTVAAQGSLFQSSDLIKLNRTQPGSERKGLAQQKLRKTYPQYYIVQLEDDALATYEGSIQGFAATKPAREGQKLNLRSLEAQDYGSYLKGRQQNVMTAMRSSLPEVIINRQLNIVLNGFVVSHPYDNNLGEKLAKIPGVKHVFEHQTYRAQMDASNELINSPEVWANVGGRANAGAGVKVAIIDGGVRPEHPMFAANGHTRPAGLPSDDYCATVDASFCNDKLVLTRYYEPTFAISPNEFESPLDFDGHGTHVAGIAVGNLVETNYSGVDVEFSGVAPGATLMVYKALFNEPDESGGVGSNVMLVNALEDAVRDGADVINNSWGGGAGGDPANSPYLTSIEAAEAAGVVVVTAAGNDGPGDRTIACPGCIESGLTVASTQTGRTFGSAIDAAGLEGIEAVVGTGNFEISANIMGPLMPAREIDSANSDACEPFPAGSLAGHILLTIRGTCDFTDKADHAEDAGAIGMILYNNAPGVIVMNMPEATLPSVSILKTSGEAILDAFTVGDEATIYGASAEVNADNVDVMSAFSSRGPNGDSSFLKPDIAAPGSDILSAYAPRGGEYNVISGTSMASPHVAGAAALLLQQKPELEPQEVKSMLMTSSVKEILKEDAETAADAFDIGAGRVDVGAAASATVSFDRVSMVSAGCVGECLFERTVTNLADDDVTLVGTVEFADNNLRGELSAAEITIAAGDSMDFDLTVDSRFADAGWAFGEVVWRDVSGSQPEARMPVVVFASGSDNEQIASNALVTTAPLIVGTPFSMRSVAGDNGGSSTSMVTVGIPEGTTLDEESLVVNEVLARRDSLAVAADKRSITWQGLIQDDPLTATIEPASGFPYAGVSLTDDDLGESVGCATGCDDEALEFSLGATIHYAGNVYNELTVSPNGFLVAGNQTLTNSAFAQELPDANAPNNVIAPLWADFQVGTPQTGDIYYASLTDGSDSWVVVEWHDVQEFGSATGDRFTFSVWFKVETNEIYFSYIDMPAAMPAVSSVGLENSSGDNGLSQYFSGTGTAPVSGDVWQVGFTDNRASVAFEYDLLPNSIGSTRSIALEATEGTAGIELDFNEVATIGTRGVAEITVSSNAGDNRAVLPITASADGAVTLEITVQPENGTLEQVPVDGAATANQSFEYIYTPNVGFSGEDSFSYKLVDEGGNESAEATASVVIRPATAEEQEPGITPPQRDQENRSEGSFHSLIALLVLPLVWLRRRSVNKRAYAPT